MFMKGLTLEIEDVGESLSVPRIIRFIECGGPTRRAGAYFIFNVEEKRSDLLDTFMFYNQGMKICRLSSLLDFDRYGVKMSLGMYACLKALLMLVVATEQ